LQNSKTPRQEIQISELWIAGDLAVISAGESRLSFPYDQQPRYYSYKYIKLTCNRVFTCEIIQLFSVMCSAVRGAPKFDLSLLINEILTNGDHY